MSRERKKVFAGPVACGPLISHTHVLFSFLSLPFSTDSHLKIHHVFVSYSSSSYYLLSLLLIGVAQERLKATRTNSSKMRFDAARLLLEAEGVVERQYKKGEEKGNEEERERVYKRNSQIPPSPLVSFYRTCYLINVVLNFILYNNNNN